MPYINISVGSKLNTLQREEIYKETTRLMHQVMGKKREVTVVQIQETPPHFWSVNARCLSENKPTCIYVNIKITHGTNTTSEKAEMISRTIKMLKDNISTVQEACYVIIDEIPADSWGYNGKTQEYRANENAMAD